MAKQEFATDSHRITMIAEGSLFEGTVQAEGDVRVGGRVVGSVTSGQRVVVAAEGAIDGTLDGDSADVAGHVQGTVRTAGVLILRASAHVEGTVEAGHLVVEDGGVLDAQVRMRRAPHPDPAPALETPILRAPLPPVDPPEEPASEGETPPAEIPAPVDEERAEDVPPDDVVTTPPPAQPAPADLPLPALPAAAAGPDMPDQEAPPEQELPPAEKDSEEMAPGGVADGDPARGGHLGGFAALLTALLLVAAGYLVFGPEGASDRESSPSVQPGGMPAMPPAAAAVDSSPVPQQEAGPRAATGADGAAEAAARDAATEAQQAMERTRAGVAAQGDSPVVSGQYTAAEAARAEGRRALRAGDYADAEIAFRAARDGYATVRRRLDAAALEPVDDASMPPEETGEAAESAEDRSDAALAAAQDAVLRYTRQLERHLEQEDAAGMQGLSYGSWTPFFEEAGAIEATVRASGMELDGERARTEVQLDLAYTDAAQQPHRRTSTYRWELVSLGGEWVLMKVTPLR